jgi:branched-chain amino acid aminotransferase
MMEHEVQRTVRRNALEGLCRVRLQVWPGNGGLYDTDAFAPHFLIECFPLQKEITKLNENGLTVGIAQQLLKSADSLANLKSCNSLIYAIAARQAKAHKWNDALICNTQNAVIESTIANIFWIKNDVVYTPPLTEGCINGVMRRHLLDKSRTKKMVVEEKKILPEELFLADEIFLTNSIRKIKWVKELSGKFFHLNKSEQFANWL